MAYNGQAKPGYKNVNSSKNPKTQPDVRPNTEILAQDKPQGASGSTHYHIGNRPNRSKSGSPSNSSGMSGRDTVGYTEDPQDISAGRVEDGNARPGGGSTITSGQAPIN